MPLTPCCFNKPPFCPPPAPQITCCPPPVCLQFETERKEENGKQVIYFRFAALDGGKKDKEGGGPGPSEGPSRSQLTSAASSRNVSPSPSSTSKVLQPPPSKDQTRGTSPNPSPNPSTTSVRSNMDPTISKAEADLKKQKDEENRKKDDACKEIIASKFDWWPQCGNPKDLEEAQKRGIIIDKQRPDACRTCKITDDRGVDIEFPCHYCFKAYHDENELMAMNMKNALNNDACCSGSGGRPPWNPTTHLTECHPFSQYVANMNNNNVCPDIGAGCQAGAQCTNFCVEKWDVGTAKDGSKAVNVKVNLGDCGGCGPGASSKSKKRYC